MTLKSYSFKKFGVFVRMLLTALRRTSDSVSLDMLTHDDLERVRARSNDDGLPVSSGPPAKGKRYLILTYVAEYDKVQYPLPLRFEEQSDINRLQVGDGSVMLVTPRHRTKQSIHDQPVSYLARRPYGSCGGRLQR